MKIDPVTGARYDHTPEEWAEVLRKMGGAGMSLPASIAARLVEKAPQGEEQEQDPSSPGKG